MERHLSGQKFLANGAFSSADIALFAYTHVAGEGGFDLSDYAAIRSWIKRIQDRPRFVAMY
jgi:glutathione S-transferase